MKKIPFKFIQNAEIPKILMKFIEIDSDLLSLTQK